MTQSHNESEELENVFDLATCYLLHSDRIS